MNHNLRKLWPRGAVPSCAGEGVAPRYIQWSRRATFRALHFAVRRFVLCILLCVVNVSVSVVGIEEISYTMYSYSDARAPK